MMHKYPKISLYANTRGNGFPLVNADGTINETNLKDMARFQLVTLNVTPYTDNQVIIPTLMRKLNPEIKILGYSLFSHSFYFATPDTVWKQIWDGLTAIDGFLYAADGTVYPNLLSVNNGSPKVLELYKNVFKQVLSTHLYDGLFLDCCSTDIAWASSDTPGNKVQDFVRAGFASAQENDISRRLNLKLFVEYIRRSFDQSQVLCINGMTQQDIKNLYFDGDMYEGFPALAGGFDATMTRLLANPKQYNWIKIESMDPATSPDAVRQGRFALASACMVDAYLCLTPYGDRPIVPDAKGRTYLNWWLDEFSVDVRPGLFPCFADPTGKHTGWLGDAVGPAEKLPNGLWKRAFPNGTVYLNPTGQDIAIDTVVTFRLISGKIDQITNHGSYGHNFTVKAQDGLFLIAVPRGKRNNA
jgi:hypothetical protein